MLEHHTFVRDEVLPSWWANAVQKYLSTGAFGFQITLQDATHIQVVAGADQAAAIITIAGLWRWNEATVNRAHPGGAAGTYDIFVTGSANSIVSVPDAYTDATNYAFALAILTAGATPTIVPGTVDVFRKVGSLQWDGSAITRIDQTVPPVAAHASSHAVGGGDPLTPAAIGAATAAALVAETARAVAAEPTAGELLALVGSSGTPGGSNTYVTNADARNTNSRLGKVPQGLDAALPSPSAALAQTLYWATDTQKLYRCDDAGSAWVAILQGAILVGCRVAASGQFVSGGAGIVWDAPVSGADPFGMWSSSHPTRLTVPTGLGGGWMVGVSLSDGMSQQSIAVNGAAYGSPGDSTATGGNTGDPGHAELLLAAGDYVEIKASFLTITAYAHLPTFSMRRVSLA